MNLCGIIFFFIKKRTINGIVDEKIKERVIMVDKNSDRVIIMIKLVLYDKVLNIVISYDPQVGLQEEMDEVMQITIK